MTEIRPRRLILTNDDGVHEPGLEALWKASEALGDRVVIAPAGPQSSCSHAVTTHRDIEVAKLAEDRFAIAGTPADCVRLGLHHLAAGTRWVLAGINAGGNLGADIHHSGTVAAAREAALHGCPAIAFSHYIERGRTIDWPRASQWAARVLKILLEIPCEPGTLWNVNLPHPRPGEREPRVVSCLVDPSPLPLAFQIGPDGRSARYSGVYPRRDRIPGSDVAVCFGGDIAVSRVRLLPTDECPPPLGEAWIDLAGEHDATP